MKIYRGAHFDETRVTQCLYHDRGQHKRCDRLDTCPPIQERSPKGMNKRDQGEQPKPRSRRAAGEGRSDPLALTHVLTPVPPVRAERAAKRTDKDTAKKMAVAQLLMGEPSDVPAGEPPAPAAWRQVKTRPFWCAQAVDGLGHRDGSCEYTVKIPMADFGTLFFPGGQARFTANGGDTVHDLPTVWRTDGALVFRFQVHPEVAMGRVILVGGLETRPHA